MVAQRADSAAPVLLSPEWWGAVIDAWNASAHTAALARLGVVCFQVADTEDSAIFVHWDDTGRARCLQEPMVGAPCFRATAATWEAFVEGTFRASAGVLQGRLEYRGPLSRVLPYSSAFNLLARVARGVPASSR